MKKVFTFITLIAIVFTMVFSTVVFADETGSITINGIVNETDTVYSIYKILNLESYNKETGVYSYKVNSDWAGFFATADAQAYFAVDAQGYATWIAAEDDSTVSGFAKKALAYAKANGISPVKSSDNAGEFVITEVDGKYQGKFSGLELGYYLVDSNVGALCGLTTTNPDASINAKNGKPTIDKQVQEDSTENWGTNNSADIGQTVNFRTTISVHAGAQNYVLHDKMDAGLTFQGVTKIEHVQPGTGTHETPATKYTVKTTGLTDGCTFEVVFTEEFCNDLETNDKVIIYYSAVLNENALVGSSNNNETWLEYGEEHYTTHSKTETFTYGFDLVKTDSQNILIDGASFRIYDALTGGNEIKVAKVDDFNYIKTSGEGVAIVVKNGKVRVEGLDNGVYYLEEVETPDGYNQLSARQKFIISDSNSDAIFNDGIFSTGSGVHVVNKSGTMLPETGGLGTTIFVTLGGVAVVAAGVLLFAKKRLSQVAE